MYLPAIDPRRGQLVEDAASSDAHRAVSGRIAGAEADAKMAFAGLLKPAFGVPLGQRRCELASQPNADASRFQINLQIEAARPLIR